MLDQEGGSATIAPVYICLSCAKPFLTEALRNRHLRYCRNHQRQRPRSCRACNTAKTKCSFDSPCSRCVGRSIECIYSTAAKSNAPNRIDAASRTRSSGAAIMGQVRPISTISDISGSNGGVVQHGQSIVYDTLLHTSQNHRNASTHKLSDSKPPTTSRTRVHKSGEDSILWGDCWDELLQSTDTMIVQVDESSSQNAPWCSWMRQGISLSIVASDMTDTLAVANTGQSLAFQLDRPHAQYNSNLIIQSLRCLPLMMRRRETFPWFIHPQSQLLHGTFNELLPGSILTCMSISQMFAYRTKETKNLLWQSINNECRRFASRMHSMTDSELLAAIQVSLIYLIMYIVDHLLGDDEGLFALLATIHDLYMLVKSKVPQYGKRGEELAEDVTWEGWILAESRRRLACLWFLVGCVVCVKNDVICDTTLSYRAIALPSSRALWDAPSQTVWETEYEESLTWRQKDLATVGDLIDAQKSRHVPANAKMMDRWNAGIDGLGSLLNLVGEMV